MRKRPPLRIDALALKRVWVESNNFGGSSQAIPYRLSAAARADIQDQKLTLAKDATLEESGSHSGRLFVRR